jgi:hypothetical protein
MSDLFPKKEEWGSGDEAMDNRLSVALKKVRDNLNFENISEFYFLGLALKPRAYNPSFHLNIEFVTKALLSQLDSEAFNDQLMQKIKGQYHLKRIVPFYFSESDMILQELKKNKMFRYKSQLDFYLTPQNPSERNPFVQYPLKRSPYDLHVKVIMKDFKSYLSGEKPETLYDDSLFRALRRNEEILVIENFGELWYHEGQIYAHPNFNS